MSKKNREIHGLTFDPDVYKSFKAKTEKIGMKISRHLEMYMREYNMSITSAITPAFVKESRERLYEGKKTTS